MMIRAQQTNRAKAAAGFTLVEVVMAIAILALVMAGIIYGYVESNYRAEWSSMSLAAQSLASKAVEQARAAKWDVHLSSSQTGSGTSDELPPTNYIQTNVLIIPGTGQPLLVTNYISVSNVVLHPPVRQLRADCVWQFPTTEDWFSNTVITRRAAD